MNEGISRILDIYKVVLHKNVPLKNKDQMFSVEYNDGI